MVETAPSLGIASSPVIAQGQDHVTVPIPNRSLIRDLIPNPEIIKEKTITFESFENHFSRNIKRFFYLFGLRKVQFIPTSKFSYLLCNTTLRI